VSKEKLAYEVKSKILTAPGLNRLVSAGASMLWGGGGGWTTAALRRIMQTTSIPAGQRKGSGYVKSQQSTKVLRLSRSNPVASRKLGMRSLDWKLAAG